MGKEGGNNKTAPYSDCPLPDSELFFWIACAPRRASEIAQGPLRPASARLGPTGDVTAAIRRAFWRCAAKSGLIDQAARPELGHRGPGRAYLRRITDDFYIGMIYELFLNWIGTTLSACGRITTVLHSQKTSCRLQWSLWRDQRPPKDTRKDRIFVFEHTLSVLNVGLLTCFSAWFNIPWSIYGL